VKIVLTTRLGRAIRLGAIVTLGIGYAVLSHLAAASTAPDVLDALVAIVPLVGLALVMAWRSPQPAVMLTLCLAACVALYGISDWLITHYNWVFLLQHAGMYALLCGAFGRTLQGGEMPMISRFARIMHGELSPALVRYTRSATWAWTFYFGGIVGVSLLLFWLAPVPVWSAFANLLGIPLLALMFAGEYAVRCYVLPAADRAGPLDAIRAYRQASSERHARRS
jgi:uncharacterized membrane protein